MQKLVCAVAVTLLGVAGPLGAQDWGSPVFLPPTAGDDLGAYFVGPEGGDYGFLALWRQAGRVDLGLRAGVLDADGELAVALGTDASDLFLSRERGLPVDVAWVLGFGGTINDRGGGTAIRVPAGLSVGAAFGSERWTLVPYTVPRVTLLARAEEDETDLDVGFNIDLAADLRLGERWLVRAGITLGADDAVGIGVAWRTPREVEVSGP